MLLFFMCLSISYTKIFFLNQVRNEMIMTSTFRDGGLIIYFESIEQIHELFTIDTTAFSHFEFFHNKTIFLDTVIYKRERLFNEGILKIIDCILWR